ncbi:hypothetical protein GUITHDRAFT_101583 [Guillardia theta CCMP2712]|uniref:rRNA adenine N(6)-methyltransferase n=1 Tax=Guillardia theta (strain CCMP2712) TaxID=905079 RepID=L1JVK2_GUITC|nr:hypothetical protein GUITHDRAFT_101583 [Guillardia theta CCMP2712]EKX52407.1 hypothetical protein GUITHDRAFT_101583 [Guillardia theta CCMP2712]|eukprot:XP_005839387.1 hypothetical protein GUITHDRAFT_101583 [Guillardia theta CCMP2712]
MLLTARVARSVVSLGIIMDLLSMVGCFYLHSPQTLLGICSVTSRSCVQPPFGLKTGKMTTQKANMRRARSTLYLSTQSDPPNEQQVELNRKERRRLNRKNRNNQRNRLTADTPIGLTSIARKKSLSQNFLVDDAIIMSLVNCVDDQSQMGCCVVELGPGLGSLTKHLLERFPRMKAVELDGQAVKSLQVSYPNLDITEQSLLDFDFKKHYDEKGERLTVISNVPFGISSSTLYKLLENSAYIRRSVLVLQQEVIDRIMSGQTQRKYGSLSIEHVIRAENIRQEMTIPPMAFEPPPRQTRIGVVSIDYQEELPLEESEMRSSKDLQKSV